MKKLITIICVVVVVLALVVPNMTSAAEKKLKFAYVCKMLTHPWFIEEENGIKAKVKEIGLDYVGVDGNLDDETFLQGVDNVIGQGANALMVVVTNQALGPAVVEKARAAKIPVLVVAIQLAGTRRRELCPEQIEVPFFALAKEPRAVERPPSLQPIRWRDESLRPQ